MFPATVRIRGLQFLNDAFAEVFIVFGLKTGIMASLNFVLRIDNCLLLFRSQDYVRRIVQVVVSLIDVVQVIVPNVFTF